MIASLSFSACGGNKAEINGNSKEQETSQGDSYDKFKLSSQERDLFKNAFNAYIVYDKGNLNDAKVMDKLLSGDDLKIDRDKNIKVKFYLHPANTIDNELSLHNVLIILYSMFYEKEEFLKSSIELGNFSIFHIEAVHSLNGKWSSNYPFILSDVIMLNENLGDIDNMIVNVEKLCKYNEDIYKGRNNESYKESLSLLRDLYEKTNNKAKVDSCNIILKKLD